MVITKEIIPERMSDRRRFGDIEKLFIKFNFFCIDDLKLNETSPGFI